jgi:hypothetical protein
MAQTLFGLTFKQAFKIAYEANACSGQIERVERLGDWERVLRNERLRGWVEWFSTAEVPIDADCLCSGCERKRQALTPEKQARADALDAIYMQALQLNAGPSGTHDFIEAKLREHLQETPDA